MNRVAELQMTPGIHRYTLGGAVVPNVTDILDGCGIGDLDHVAPHILEAARERGTTVHNACAFYDQGETWYYKNPAHEPYVDSYIRFRKDTGFEPTLIECRVLSEKYGYCGTLDRVGDLQGVETQIDFKTGSAGPGTGPQTAAYNQAVEESYGIRPARRFALVLNPGKYELVPLTDSGDWKVFLAALTVHNFKTRKP